MSLSGTFARGIAYSGSALAQWTHSIKPVEKAKALAAIVGCPTTTNKEMVDCLKYRPAEMIVNAQIEMFVSNYVLCFRMESLESPTN